MKWLLKNSLIDNEKGVVAPIVAVCLILFVGFTALAVDIGHLYVARNELQNAADAGALAGASCLFCQEASSYCSAAGCPVGEINPDANARALSAATDNKSENAPVEVLVAEVERGHWSFATHTFAPNDTPDQVDLWGVSAEELDTNPAFINAVRVTTRRSTTPVSLYFANIFGMESQAMTAQAIGYRGFAGSLNETEADTPIAICDQAITRIVDGKRVYDCGEGRMSNSNNNVCDSNTTAWTDFAQPCEGAADANTMRSLVCGSGNSAPINMAPMSAVNGVQMSVFSDFRDCWWAKSEHGTKPWEVTLPIIDCEDYPGPVDNCSTVVGAVTVNIMWVQERANQCDVTGYYPTVMAGIPGSTPPYANWTAPVSATPAQIWDSFFNHFHLKNSALDPTCITKCDSKAIYFLPDCTPHDAVGGNGGPNRGVFARIPVLVN